MEQKVCAICGKAITNKQEYIETADHEFVHRNCAIAQGLNRCECCHGYILNRKGVRRCKRCEEQIYTNDINGYSTKPVPQFKNYIGEQGKEYPVRYYGLEMEFNNCDPSRVHSLGGNLYSDKWIYNKRDGSISYGVEVVTSPLDRKSVNILMKNMQPIFDYVGKYSYSEGAGLHIHVTKKSISPQDRYKLCILLNGKKTLLERNVMYYLSGRATNPMSENEGGISDGYFGIGYGEGLCPQLTGHSVALNTSNSATYEFRIFKSSNKPDVLLSYVEMVDTMIDFCHNNGIKDITISNYIEYLKTNSKNKILLDKIKRFEKVVHKVKSSRPILLNGDKIQLLNGIRWNDYYAVLYWISRYRYKDFRNISSIVHGIIIGQNSFKIPDDDLCQRLNKTLRACLIKEIIKTQKEMEKCV